MKTVLKGVVIITLFSFLLIGCQVREESVHVASQVVEEDMGDVIYTNSTIIIQPSQSQIDSILQKVDSSDFHAGQDDYVFYANEMTGFFSDKHVVNYIFTGVHSLNYKNGEGKMMKYNLEHNGESWQLYFYSPEKGFRRIDFLNYESEFEKFFN